MPIELIFDKFAEAQALKDAAGFWGENIWNDDINLYNGYINTISGRDDEKFIEILCFRNVEQRMMIKEAYKLRFKTVIFM